MLAERDGQRTARARYHAMQGRLAYGAVADWLRTAALHTSLSQLDPIWLTELARLLPELLIQHPTLQPPQPMYDAWQRKQLFEALTHAFTQGRGPLLLILDDLQWCDVDTLEWLQYLLERVTLPLLLVATVRSDELTADHPLHGLRHQLQRSDQITEIGLAPLTVRATGDLATQVGEQPLSDERAAALYHEMAGNPLFIIERVRMGLTGEASPAEQVATVADVVQQAVAIPPKVYSVIQARLAQLSPAALALAQLGATIGRAFDVVLLAQAADQPEEVVLNGLDELWQRRIIRAVDALHYDFSHDRIRDVAYGEIGPVRQRLLHGAVAQTIEKLHVNALDVFAGELADHYHRSGRLDKALAYFRQAATVAQGLFASKEVAVNLEKALAVAQAMPKSTLITMAMIDMWHELGHARIRTHDFGSEPVVVAWDKAYELALEEGSPFQQCRALLRKEMYHRNRGEWKTSRRLTEEALAILPDIDDPYLLILLYNAYGGLIYHMGEPVHALTYLDKALTLAAEPIQQSFGSTGNQPNINSLARSAKALGLAGYPDKARTHSAEALRLMEASIDVEVFYGALDFSAMLYSFLRDGEMVEKLGHHLIELTQKYEFPFYERAGTMFVGWAQAHAGETAYGIRLVSESIDGHRSRGIRMFEPYWRGMLAETLALAHEIAPAMAEVDDALNYAQISGNSYWNAQLLKQKGDYHALLSAPPAEVEACYQQAIATARQQQARFLELRATTSLCRLWQQQGRQDEAQPLLAAIYGWFTEGFDTLDLIEAKALLDELAP